MSACIGRDGLAGGSQLGLAWSGLLGRCFGSSLEGLGLLGWAWPGSALGSKWALKMGSKKCIGLGPNQNNNKKNTIEWNKKKNKVAINKYAITNSNTIFKNTKKNEHI